MRILSTRQGLTNMISNSYILDIQKLKLEPTTGIEPCMQSYTRTSTDTARHHLRKRSSSRAENSALPTLERLACAEHAVQTRLRETKIDPPSSASSRATESASKHGNT